MDATGWQVLQEIVETAAALPPAARAGYLEQRCGADPTLRLQAQSLLAGYSQAGELFDEVVASAAARMMSGMDLSSGDSVGPYRIVRMLGRGGMGTVYLAQRADEHFRQHVAIKIVGVGLGVDLELFARFRAERQILANINHLNIARLLDGGITQQGFPYLVMEFVEGTTLDQYLVETQPSLSARIVLFRDICAAVQHAHQNLVVHRDLKPGNVMITAEGTPKLLDFGIAKLLAPDEAGEAAVKTRAAERLMTPAYASPEQVRGEAVTTATDVYGLGALLYEVLTGTRPFSTGNLSAADAQRLICEVEPVPPSVVGLQTAHAAAAVRKQTDLDRIVLKALHKLPERRYPSAAELSTDLGRYLEGFPVTARPDSVAYRARRFVGRHRIAVAAAVLFVGVITALSISVAIQARRAKLEAATANSVSDYLVGLFQFSRPDTTQGRSVSAREMLDTGTEHLERGWTGSPLVKARLLSTLGDVYYQLGALDQADPLLAESENIYSRQQPRSLAEAETANTLAQVALFRGDYVRSEQQYRRSLELYEHAKGHNTAEVADVLDGLGLLRWTLGDFDAAEEYEKQAIAIDTKVLGPEAMATLTDKGNIEIILADRGDYKAAEPLVREILRERTRMYGLDNSNTASSMNNLAFILQRTGRFPEANAMLQQTLGIRRKLYGSEHSDIASSLVALGWYEREVGDFAKARDLTQQGLAMTTRLQGPTSLHTAFDEDALGLVFIEAGDPAAARPWVEKALAVRLANSHPSAPALSQSYDHLGLIDLEQGKLAPARSEIEHALALKRSFYRRDNDAVATSLNNLGRVLEASGDATGALQVFQKAEQIATLSFGQTPHPITAAALYGEGEALLALHRPTDAASVLNESLRMRQAFLEPNHPDMRLSLEAVDKLKS